MSWNHSFKTTVGNVARDAATSEFGKTLQTGNGEEEAATAYAVAIGLAETAASAVGVADDPVTVTVSGHANTNHDAQGGWAKDEIRITVTRF